MSSANMSLPHEGISYPLIALVGGSITSAFGFVAAVNEATIAAWATLAVAIGGALGTMIKQHWDGKRMANTALLELREQEIIELRITHAELRATHNADVERIDALLATVLDKSEVNESKIKVLEGVALLTPHPDDHDDT